MAYIITEACIGVKGEACMEVCPEFCIFSEPDDEMSYIDPNRCIDCGACMAACVVGAIYPEETLPAASSEFAGINAYWFKHKTGVRQRVREIGKASGLLV
ncbi:MAG: indolepyruvate ferredoxin oxidoreductase subunit alpha [Sphingomonadales bacterium]